jgi:hypothetical protein
MANRTLSSYREARQRGLPVMVRGYWGDILVTPFIAFGVQSEAKVLFEVRQEQQVKVNLPLHPLIALYYECMRLIELGVDIGMEFARLVL